jgi:hypothetical protein
MTENNDDIRDTVSSKKFLLVKWENDEPLDSLGEWSFNMTPQKGDIVELNTTPYCDRYRVVGLRHFPRNAQQIEDDWSRPEILRQEEIESEVLLEFIKRHSYEFEEGIK